MIVQKWRQANLSVGILGDADVHLWRVSLQATAAELEQAKLLLSDDELARGERFVREHLRRRYCLAHAWKRLILARYLKQTPQSLDFTLGEHGKPYLQLAVGQSLQFNMSHSGEMALFAVTRKYEVGVDIEYARSQIEALSLAERFFTSYEYQQITNLPAGELLGGFYRIWTLKEAVIKALGTGLSQSLSSFAVMLGEDFRHCLYHIDVSLQNDSGQPWSVFAFPAGDDYAGACALRAKVEECCCWDLLGVSPIGYQA